MFDDQDERMRRASDRVRASATPAQRVTMEMVDAAFAAEVDDFEARRKAEDNLRAWAENLTGIKMDFSEIEELRSKALAMKAGGTLVYKAKRGTVHLYRTAFGTIDRVDRYLNTLERTVIDITNNSQFTALPFRGLIALAFQRLINRGNQWVRKNLTAKRTLNSPFKKW